MTTTFVAWSGSGGNCKFLQ